MRFAIVVVLLVGSGWGQNNGIARDTSTKVVCGAIDPEPEGCPKPEPMDVPAVQEPAPSVGGSVESGMLATYRCSNGGRYFVTGHLEGCTGGHTTTCADKRRVLLTSEDGKKHCILFSPATQVSASEKAVQ